MSKKIAVIASTGASVARTVYEGTCRSDFDIDLMIVDRDCGAKDFAKSNNIEVVKVGEEGVGNVSDEILLHLRRREIDCVYLFFTRLLKGKILQEYGGKIINFHPSLLPACPGLHGFEDTLKSGSMLAGSTVHFVDAGMDTGKIVLQAFSPVHGVDASRLRHVIFSQQCASLYAVHRRIASGRPLVDGDSSAHDASQGFLPNIDADSIKLYRSILSRA